MNHLTGLPHGLGSTGTAGAAGPAGPTGPQGVAGVDGVDGSSSAGTVVHSSWLLGTNNITAGFFSDDYISIGWDGAMDVVIRQPTARSNVYASRVSNIGGNFQTGLTMILSTNDTNYYRNTSTGSVFFTISSDSDNTHPFYRVHVQKSSSSSLDYMYAAVEKFQ